MWPPGLRPTLADTAHMAPSVVSRVVTRYAAAGEDSDAAWRRLSSEVLRSAGWDGFVGRVDAWCSPFKGVHQDQQRFKAHDIFHLGYASTSRGSPATVPALRMSRC